MSNFYEVLDIEKSADEGEIKRAYVKLLRKYPPEKAPEEFKKIREAYEMLIDPISRAEYDALSQYGDLIERFDEIGKEALERKDYKAAINAYKKILIIEPNLAFAKNMLGLSLLYDEQYEEAKEQFEELVKISPDNAVYYTNLASVYMHTSDYDRAEQVLLKAHELDPIDNVIVTALVQAYVRKKEYDKAISFLEGCVGKNKADVFQDFPYYLEMIKLYIYKNDLHKIEETIDKIKEIIPDKDGAREYVALEVGRLAYQLYEIKAYGLAAKIFEKTLEIDNNDDLKELFRISKELYNIYSASERLMNDERVIAPIKGPIFYYVYGDELEEEELKKRIDENLRAIEQYLIFDYFNVIRSIEILRDEYNVLYIPRSEFYDEVYKIARDKMANEKPSDRRENESRNTKTPNGDVAYEISDPKIESVENSNKLTTPDHSPSAKGNKGKGCLTIFMFGLIGAHFANGVGFVIGLILGFYIISKSSHTN